MPALSNFLQWNPTAANMQTDAQYSADVIRSGGAVAGPSLFPSITANKLFYQLSTFAAGFGQMMVRKGYTITDADLNALATALGNVMTQADMAPYATLASPAFTGSPTTTTPPANDNSNRIPNTSWLDTLFARLISPNFTGIPTVPTPVRFDNGATIPNTAWNNTYFARLDTPAFVGVPTVPTPAQSDNSAQVPNTAWIDSFFARLISPNFAGVPTTTQPGDFDSSSQIANTGWVRRLFNPLLNFFPVQQGGGTGQSNNKLFIGWDGARPKLTVDATDLGRFAMASDLGTTTVRVDTGYLIVTLKQATGFLELAFGAGTGQNGQNIPLPAGFSYSQMAGHVSPNAMRSNTSSATSNLATFSCTLSGGTIGIFASGSDGTAWPQNFGPPLVANWFAFIWRQI